MVDAHIAAATLGCLLAGLARIAGPGLNRARSALDTARMMCPPIAMADTGR